MSKFTCIKLADQSSNKSFPSPTGFVLKTKPTISSTSRSSSSSSSRAGDSRSSSNQSDQVKNVALREKKAWDFAMTGAKQIPMNLFMMYMSGNSLQIFSIFITVMMFWNPIKSITGMKQGFQPLEGVGSDYLHLRLQKLVFILFQLANMGLALYKCQQMGLLPTTESDWLAFLPPKLYLEDSAELLDT